MSASGKASARLTMMQTGNVPDPDRQNSPRRVAQPFPKVLKWVPHPSRFWCMGRVRFFGPVFDSVFRLRALSLRSSTSLNNTQPKTINKAEKPHPR